jgi:integrase
MARTIEKLSALRVSKETKPGLYNDGGGLYLRVGAGGAKSWVFRYMLDGQAREMGFGATHAVTLAQARQKAQDARNLLAEGNNPLSQKRAAEAERRLKEALKITFRDCAERYIVAHEKSWRNEKHRAQWRSTLETYAYPELGELPVAAVDTALVTKILEHGELWSTKPETASRLRGRIEVILDWARVRGYRDGENPARWRGHLENLFPAKRKVRRVKHHAALPYGELGEFMRELTEREGISARGLEFTILTAARTGEVIGARWNEIKFDEKVWTVPAERMKAGREHRVPLSDRVIEILKALPHDSKFVFPGQRLGEALSNMAMLETLKRMDRDDLTVHGFRSTFRDWAAERTNFPAEVAEAALAHVVGDRTEAAYRRGDLFEKRRRLMDEWSEYASTITQAGDAPNVVPLRSAAG